MYLYTLFFIENGVDVYQYFKENIPPYAFAFFTADDMNPNVVIPDGIEYICVGAYDSAAVKNVYIPKSVKAVNAGAFSDCYDIQFVQIEGNPFIYMDNFLTHCAFRPDVKITFKCKDENCYKALQASSQKYDTDWKVEKI